MRAAIVAVVGALALACGGESGSDSMAVRATGGVASAPIQSSGSGGSEAPGAGGTTSGAAGVPGDTGSSGAGAGGKPQAGGPAGVAGRFYVGGQAGVPACVPGDFGSAGDAPAGAAGIGDVGGGGAAGSPAVVTIGGAETGGTGGSGGGTTTGGASGSGEAGGGGETIPSAGHGGEAGAVVCECDEGPCCDGCHFLPSDTLCFEATYDVCLPLDRYCREYEGSVVHLIPAYVTIHVATHCFGNQSSCGGGLDVWEETRVCCPAETNDCWQHGDPGAMNWWEFDEELIPTVECHMPPTYGQAGAGGATP